MQGQQRMLLYVLCDFSTRWANCALCQLCIPSERLDRSLVEDLRKREACSINQSLSALGDVFAALSSKTSHVPYRNSKLTYLLQVRMVLLDSPPCCPSTGHLRVELGQAVELDILPPLP
jgi:hypothetical protein